MIKYTPIAKNQIGLICRSIKLGSVLQKELGTDITHLYRQGYTLQRIAEFFDIQRAYNVSRNIAKAAVFRVLAGHSGGLDVESYEGLMSQEERTELGRQHKKDAGDRVVREGLGVHGFSPEQRESFRIKGLEALTPEKRILAGRNAAISMGFVPFVKDEVEYILRCRSAPEYRRGTTTNNDLIAREVNQNWHGGKEVRDGLSIYALAARIRKAEKKVLARKTQEQAL